MGTKRKRRNFTPEYKIVASRAADSKLGAATSTAISRTFSRPAARDARRGDASATTRKSSARFASARRTSRRTRPNVVVQRNACVAEKRREPWPLILDVAERLGVYFLAGGRRASRRAPRFEVLPNLVRVQLRRTHVAQSILIGWPTSARRDREGELVQVALDRGVATYTARHAPACAIREAVVGRIVTVRVEAV